MDHGTEACIQRQVQEEVERVAQQNKFADALDPGRAKAFGVVQYFQVFWTGSKAQPQADWPQFQIQDAAGE